MKCLKKVGYTEPNNLEISIFYDWRKKVDWEMPGCADVSYHMEKWIDEEQAEAMLLKEKKVKPEYRMVFWFDN